MLHVIACLMMVLLHEFMNKERNFWMKKQTNSLLKGETNQEFAEFTALHGQPPVFDTSPL